MSTMPANTACKFNADGSVKRYPGTTFVSAVAPDHTASPVLEDLARRLKASSVGARITFLPRSSYHMTVFEGICTDEPDAAYWPADLMPGATLDEAVAFFEARIDGLPGLAAPITVRPTGLFSHPGGLGVALEREALAAHLRAALPTLTLPAPDFCTFESMYAFPPRRSMAV